MVCNLKKRGSQNKRDDVTQALEDSGTTNPKFLKTLKRAEERFARVAHRDALNDGLSGKIIDLKTGEVSYNCLLIQG